MNTVLAELGNEGWELVTMNRLTTRQITGLLKLPVENESKESNSEVSQVNISEDDEENSSGISEEENLQ